MTSNTQIKIRLPPLPAELQPRLDAFRRRLNQELMSRGPSPLTAMYAAFESQRQYDLGMLAAYQRRNAMTAAIQELLGIP